ncbi:C45 family autoproteolytic acyltransferase/hydolase [Paenibacillus sp. GCM10028914]|uniref:C45 family autoproteolytic acyltransferase/hydolase n=1 Tax=Paenibacillus sp. GCM10028914 TaxID=3273416 RepID=UPI00361ACD85
MLNITLRGTPYEIGFQHGETLKPLVKGIVQHLVPSDMEFQHKDVEETITLLKKNFPELLEEMKGIADGSDIPFEKIVSLNIKILHYCTVIAFEESDVGPILGKNFDFPGYAFQTLFHVIPNKGHSFVHLGCAGSISSYGGINIKGLAMGHAVVFLREQENVLGIPIAFVRRLALQYCSTTKEAIEYVASIQTQKVGDNILFLDSKGEARVIEKAPKSFQVRKPESRIVYCTNSFVHEDHSHYIDDGSDGSNRHKALGHLLPHDNLTEQSLKTILSNKEGNYPICRKTTQVSFVAFPEKLMLKVTDGKPVAEGYKDFIITL